MGLKVWFKILLLLLPCWAVAQGQKSVEMLETFPVNAEVIGVLEDNDRLAILKITKVDSNGYGLEAGTEILAEFYFTTRPMANEKNLEGIEAGDKISLRLNARKRRSSPNWEYMAFHYVVYSEAE